MRTLHRWLLTNPLWAITLLAPLSLQERSVKQENKTISVPMYFDKEGHIFVDAMINDRGPYRIGVDTGCTITTLSTKMVKQLGIRRNGTLKIALDTAEVKDVSIQVSDAYGGNSMIGWNFLKEWVVTLDYPQKTIYLEKQIHLAKEKKIAESPIAYIALSDPIRKGIFTIQLHINGKGPFEFIFDTGAPRNIIHPNLAKKLNLQKSGKRGVTVDFALRALEIKEQKCSIEIPQAVSALKNWDGLLGAPFHKELVITIDYANNKVYFRKKS